MRDILKGDDPQLTAFRKVVAQVAPDILVLQDVDYDLGLTTLTALRDMIRADGPDYPHLFARRPNSGLETGLDMDGDGRLGQGRDAQGFGLFAGQGGMAILSRFPFDPDKAQDFGTFLWKDLPGAIMPIVDGTPFPSAEAAEVQRLSSVAHWVVPVILPQGRIDLLAFHASPPVFDGPEDLNGRRNHDEIRFWQLFLDGQIGEAPTGAFVLLGDANLDPHDSDGRNRVMRNLLADPRLQDPRPLRPGVVAQDAGQVGDPRLDTVAWPKPDPGHLRVDYVLPAAGLKLRGSGVYWPPDNTPEAEVVNAANHHRMVWVDLVID